MTKRGDEPQSPRHVIIYDSDWEMLSQLFGSRGLNPSISVSEAVKKIVHQKVLALKARFAGKLDQKKSKGEDDG